MSFSFTVAKPKDISATFKKLKERCEKYKGYLRGDEKSGDISSDGVVGTYETMSDCIKITVTKKPLPIIPNGLIEKEIKSIFNEVSLQ